ncbi:hypothetical protein V1478_015457, partial [Vespula squamosa]
MRIVERRTSEQTRLWDSPRRLSTNVPLNNWVLARETGAPCKDSQLADPNERIWNDRVQEMFRLTHAITYRNNSFAKRTRKTLTPVVLETPREFLLTFPVKALQVQPVEGSTPKYQNEEVIWFHLVVLRNPLKNVTPVVSSILSLSRMRRVVVVVVVVIVVLESKLEEVEKAVVSAFPENERQGRVSYDKSVRRASVYDEEWTKREGRKEEEEKEKKDEEDEEEDEEEEEEEEEEEDIVRVDIWSTGRNATFLEEAAGFESKGGSESVTLSNASVERIEGNSCRARLIAVQRDPAGPSCVRASTTKREAIKRTMTPTFERFDASSNNVSVGFT